MCYNMSCKKLLHKYSFVFSKEKIMVITPILIIVCILVSASIFVNGWTDAPNAIATVVSTRVLSPKAAVLLATVFNLLGVVFFGSAVAKTINELVKIGSGNDALITLAAAQLAIVIWSVSAWKYGIPTSESHALIAGLMGAAMAFKGTAAFNWGPVLKVVYGLLISTVIGFVLAIFLTKFIGFLFRKVKRRAANTFFSIGQIISASAMAFSHGAQDGSKFMGVFVTALIIGGVVDSSILNNIPLWIKILCALIMAIGTSIGGYRIIKTMGVDMVKLEKYQGFSSEVVASACMLAATYGGIPLSTTNTKGTAMMGAGASRKFSDVNWNVAKEMILAWVLTFPACLLMGYLMTKLFIFIF
jgi:PiT family inorganic phosphate transporter